MIQDWIYLLQVEHLQSTLAKLLRYPTLGGLLKVWRNQEYIKESVQHISCKIPCAAQALTAPPNVVYIIQNSYSA